MQPFKLSGFAHRQTQAIETKPILETNPSRKSSEQRLVQVNQDTGEHLKRIFDQPESMSSIRGDVYHRISRAIKAPFSFSYRQFFNNPYQEKINALEHNTLGLYKALEESRAQVNELKQETLTLKDRLTSYSTDIASIELNQTRLRNARAKIKALKIEMIQAQEIKQSQELDYEHLASENMRLVSKINAQAKDMNTLEHNLKMAHEEISQMRSRAKTAESSLLEQITINDTIKSEHQKNQTKLKQELKKKEAEYAQLKTKANNHSNEARTLRLHNYSLASYNTSLAHHNAILISENQELRSQFDNTQMRW